MGQVFMFGATIACWACCHFFTRSDSPVTLWLPAVVGVGVVYHPNPLDAQSHWRAGARLFRVTFLLATPTFLQLYMRGARRRISAACSVVMAGAEKLPERLATGV